MVPGSKPGMNGASGFQKGLSCESCHSEYTHTLTGHLKEKMSTGLCYSLNMTNKIL